ncbi:hypothetical protein [Subtercola boreus]|uniref:Histidine kinase n=1 Tax=Subtercola boreus TaxID=120213 RepID=A0A3E0WF65_9MICO|nr:hypothetical protein [Subtercola boreus]RFA22678.1 hypothetical protein B7R24_03430 [Subtercola boreus]RFA23033.1 hypothetical protein B7R23_03425 [Subtercola boreus]RFA28785.1 hypothetical protein B7R25_03440 [Subtercola boreus]
MDDQAGTHETGSPERSDGPLRRPVLLVLLALLLLVEALAVLAIGVALVAELVLTTPESYATAIALIVLVLAAGVWVLFIAVGTYRLRPWTRGAALTWQVLQVIVAICIFQGLFADAVDGWPLLLVSLLGIVLLLAPSVVAVTRRI